MGTVPLLFDKSAFQGLNKREHSLVWRYFIPNVTPVLFNEIVGDLKKTHPDGKLPEDEVAKLASKFFGTGSSINVNYREMMWASLDGADVPMTGQILPENVKMFTDEDGESSMLIVPGPENWVIMRLAQKIITEEDRAVADAWRSATANMSLAKLTEYLNRNHVIVPSARSINELPAVVDTLLDHSGLQDVWFGWVVGTIRRLVADVRARWQREGSFLKTFAPYAHFCLRALVMLFIANRRGLLPRWKSTHLVDAQYLYYLPCCGVFVSADRLHRTLGPPLCRPDQRFIRAEDFKSGLAQLGDHLDKLDADQREQFKSRPPKLDGNVVTDAWHHVVAAWDELWIRGR
jgi:hypothetical protein